MARKVVGYLPSTMEHLVPEQMFSTEDAPADGVSAVKAIALAAAEGQRIYTITADNVEQALAQINISAATEQEIRNAAYSGKIITTHQHQINFHGWIGEGYIIIDPTTGAGAYKIAGGGNGGFLLFLISHVKKLIMKAQFWLGTHLSNQTKNIVSRFIVKSLGLVVATVFDFYKILSKCSGSVAAALMLVTFLIALSIAILLFFAAGWFIIPFSLGLPVVQNMIVGRLINDWCENE